MSSSVKPWIRKYLTDVATEYGILDSRIPAAKTRNFCQITKFLTFETERKSDKDDTPTQDCVWAEISDKNHRVAVKFAAEAVVEFYRDPNYREKRLTQCVGAVISITNFRPCFRQVAIQEGKGLSSQPTLSFDVPSFKIRGSIQEQMWGNPKSLKSDPDLKSWMDEMSKENGDVNILKNRNRPVKPVQKEIESFNEFPLRMASPPRVQATTPVVQKFETTKPIQRRERSREQLYRRKWKRVLGGSYDSYAGIQCLPQGVADYLISEAQQTSRQPKTKANNGKYLLSNLSKELLSQPQFAGRGALDLDSSQATDQWRSPTGTPEPSTPPPEEWPQSQTTGPEVELADGSCSQISHETSSDELSASEESHEDDDPALLGSPMMGLNLILSERTGAGSSKLSASIGQLPPKSSAEQPSPGLITTTVSSDSHMPTVFGETSNLPAKSAPVQGIIQQHEADFSLPPPTPAQRPRDYDTSIQTEATIPDSSFPPPPTFSRSDESGQNISQDYHTRYTTKLNRKVPIPKQGPPFVPHLGTDPHGVLIFVPASDGSASQSQSQSVVNDVSQSQPDRMEQVFNVQQEMAQNRTKDESQLSEVSESKPLITPLPGGKTESLETDTNTQQDKSESQDPGEGALMQEESLPDPDEGVTTEQQNSNVDSIGQVVRPSEVSLGKRPGVPRQQISALPSPPLNLGESCTVLDVDTPITDSTPKSSPRPTTTAQGQLLRARQPTQATRLPPNDLKATLTLPESSCRVSATHDPVAWQQPAFQRDRNPVNGKKRKAETLDPENPGPRTRQKIVEIPERALKNQNSHASEPAPQTKRRSARSKVLASHLPLPKPRDPEPSRVRTSVQPTSTTTSHPMEKLGGARVSFEVPSIPEVPLLTYESLSTILLRTGRMRYKMLAAKADHA